MRVFVSCLALALACSSCVPALIGAVAYKSSKTRQAKESFIAQFNQTNIEREKAGLPPLDLCTEKYGFDRKWADDDPVCKERIERYEAGDTSALGNAQLVKESDEDVKTTPSQAETGQGSPAGELPAP